MKYPYGIFLAFVLLVFLVGMGFRVFGSRRPPSILSPIAQIVERPLDKYTIDHLSRRQSVTTRIVFDQASATTSAYTEYTFHYVSDGKKVSGLAHVPNDASVINTKPVIVQIRGYVERSIYTPGAGTKRSAEVFAKNGFISLAPDFLGYGDSDNPGKDVFEERFQTYTATLDLFSAIPSLVGADPRRVGIWAHSNGGQIALTVLEVTRKPYPTTLWAPVSRAFPYSVLYYTDEAEDKGKALRKKLADFEKQYDGDLYSMTNYIDRITAPIQLHQGSADDAVPIRWSEEFVADLKKENITIGYFLYPGADHNLQPSWNTVISRDITFFRKYFTP